MVPKSDLRILGKVRVSSLGKASEEYTSFFELLVRDPLLILQATMRLRIASPSVPMR